MRTPKRQDSDNTDLDLTIAEWFGTDVDTIDNIDFELIEIIRKYIWKKQHRSKDINPYIYDEGI